MAKPDSAPVLNFDPSDPLQVAVKITQMEGVLARAQEGFNVASQTMNQGMADLRTEIRAVSDQLKDLPKLANAQEGHGSGLERAFKAIENLANETNRSFRERDDDLDAWKERYEAERDRWRSTHEEDNRKTREKLILWNGVGLGISLLASALVGTVLYIYTGDKAAARDALARLESKQDAANQAAVARSDRNGSRLTEVERYLTQEGTISGRPYVPSQQRP